MVTVFIKSFNRAFYLDRSLQSIKNFVEGDFMVIVLDDGTPEKYLQKIQGKYPEIEIRKSNNYKNKVFAIEENLKSGKEIDGFSIPTDLWIEAVKNASEYFIMTEDDVWFTQKINVDELQKACMNHKISLLKLGWLGNNKDDENLEISPIAQNLCRTKPRDLWLFPEPFNDWFFYNRFKFFTVLYKLGIADHATKRKYWALNSILMGFWHKTYWLEVWKGAQGRVDEKQQLRNAAAFYRKNLSNPNFVARVETEVMKTTFQSSATNSYHPYGEEFDVNYFNHLMNEAWCSGLFDAMHNFPNDFPMDYFEQFFDDNINKKAFRNWVEKFKNQYRNLGCTVD